MNLPIKRIKRGKGFQFSINGKTVDMNTLQRIAGLSIPPAWTDVEIALGSKNKVQATGFDTQGRKQYIYSKAYTQKQERAKFDRISEFAMNLPRMRRRVEKDLNRKRFDKRKVVAAAVSLLDQEYFRVGNEQYAKTNNSYGLTTLRSKHVLVEDNKVVFDFIGKSGQAHHKVIKDNTLAKIISILDDMPGYEIFRYYDTSGKLHNVTSADVNEYIKETMGAEYSAKDFRTWGGTLLAAVELVRETRPSTNSERKRVVTACIKRVAKKLGNTPAIARSSYIDSRIFDIYDGSDGIREVYETVKSIKPRKYLSYDERWVLKLLSK